MPQYRVDFPEGPTTYKDEEDLVEHFGTIATYKQVPGGIMIYHPINPGKPMMATEVPSVGQEIHEGPTTE